MNTELIDKAIIFATNAHANVSRKSKDTPYILHPLEAAAIVASMTSDPEIIAATILHDTVEDNKNITLDIIENEFGAKVRYYVASESEQKEADAVQSWKKRKSRMVERLMKTEDNNVRMIALGDKLSNIRAMYLDQYEVGHKLWERFNQTDKDEHGWYYKSLIDALSPLSEHLAYREYCDLVNRVFGDDGE